MGSWGTKAWDSDAAADWFNEAFDGALLDSKLDEAFEHEDNYDEIRAACYVLTTLGRSRYIWPGDLDRLEGHVARGAALMADMLDPRTESGEEMLELWEGLEVFVEIEAELAALRAAHGLEHRA